MIHNDTYDEYKSRLRFDKYTINGNKLICWYSICYHEFYCYNI